ncbi:MAG: SEC-C metal-binding domain-containing protein [bacterium]
MKVGRNDPCPCGSGKKYKKCCLSKTYASIGRELTIQNKLIKDLIEFYHKNYMETIEDAKSLLWGDFKPEDYLKEDYEIERANINFIEYLVYDFIVDYKNDKTVIDKYLETCNNAGSHRNLNNSLSLEETGILTAMKNSFISLFEVKEVFKGEGLLLKDILTNKEYDVKEKSATESLVKWDILATRLAYLDEQYIMSGSGYFYPLIKKEEILNKISLDYKDYKTICPNAPITEYLKKNSEIFNSFWYSLYSNPTPANLRNTDGEQILFSKAIFDIKDKSAVINRLKSIKDFKYDEENDVFVWVDETPGRKVPSTNKGTLQIKNDKLTIECNSKERISAAKIMILENLSDFLVHKADVFQSLEKAISEFNEKNEGSQKQPENEIPIEIQQEFINKFLTDHYEKWLNEKIPALNGKTPLEAIKTKKGRHQVIEILKFNENIEEKNKEKGKPYYDFSWLRKRLGLEDDCLS